MLTNSKPWLWFKARLAELTSKFALLDAAAIAGLKAGDQLHGSAAWAMGILVFIQFIVPEQPPKA